MELRVLQYFLTVVQEENISRAAEVLHVTQPTLSRQMAQLEEELGVQLFVRGRHLTLTDAASCCAGVPKRSPLDGKDAAGAGRAC